MKVTKHFSAEEILHPSIIETYGLATCKFALETYALEMLKALETMSDFISNEPIIINDYKWGGGFTNSGVRVMSDPVGSALSGHYAWRCCDLKFKTRDPIAVQDSIMENQHMHPNIVRMEDARITKTWLHLQFGTRLPNEHIAIFKP